MNSVNPLYDPKKHDAELNPELMKSLNSTLVDPAGFSDDDKAFLEEIIRKVNSGVIDLYVASSLYNQKVVDRLDSEGRARVETQAQSLLATIRDLMSFWEYDHKPSYEVINLIQKLRVTKERFELKEGDVFII